MIQERLQKEMDVVDSQSSFSSALIHVMIDFLPEVMSNQFGNYLCQKLIEVAPV